MAAYTLNANPQWIKIKSFTHATVDAVAATSGTLACDPIQSKGGGSLIVHDCMAVVRTVFDGAGTVLLDVGRVSGTLPERYMKDQSIKAATGRFLGSSDTTNVKPRVTDSNGFEPYITITSGSGNLSTFTTGECDVYLLVSAAP